MKGLRQARIPIDHFVAELAAAPLAWEELVERAPTYLDPRRDPGPGGGAAPPFPGVPLDGPVWRDVELALLRRFPSFSVDEVVAFRDEIWFGESDGAPRPLGAYLRRLATQLLHVDGSVARPRTPLWRMQVEARRSEARVAAQWMTFALPVDLLIAAHPGSRAHIPAHTFEAGPLHQHFRDHGFAELHCHFGNAVPFELVWVWTQRSVVHMEYCGEDLPGAPFGHGRGLASWLLLAAVARWMLAWFLIDRCGHNEHSFEDFLNEELLGGYDAGTIWHALACFIDPPPGAPVLEADHHAQLLSAYVARTGITTASWPVWSNLGLGADPLCALFTGRTGSAEQQLVRDALLYLDEVGAARPCGEHTGDELFERVFWQTVRIRNVFYRALVQRPMTAGLMWFVRFNARRRAIPAPVDPRRHVIEATQTCGRAHGLQSLELRVPPPKDDDAAVRYVQSVRCAWCALSANPVAPATPILHGMPVCEIGGGIDTPCALRGGDLDASGCGTPQPPRGPLEIGVVIHFSRDRGGSFRDARPVALRRSSYADPRLPENYGVRFRAYAGPRWNEAMILAGFLRKYPASLRVIRGLDVCSDELGIPVWVLAAVLRGVRRAADRASAAYRAQGVEVPSLRATAHAGEDFVHLLGGLRRVHETLHHLTTREGDRIGHALALGVDPTVWAQSAGACAVSLEERLFDLVWAWDYVGHDRLDVPGDTARKLEHEIAQRSRELFGKEKSPSTLWEVINALYGDATARELRGMSPATSPVPQKNAKARHVERLRHRFMTEGTLFDRGSKIVIVDPEPEVPLLDALQRAVRREVGTRGVAIEVNPSSNLLIGDLADLQRHPLWRLAPPVERDDLPPVDVVVGSDNPLMLSTDTLQEYQRLYDAMRLSGISEGAAWAWIDRARHASLRYRFTLRDPPLRPDAWVDTSVQDPLDGWQNESQQ